MECWLKRVKTGLAGFLIFYTSASFGQGYFGIGGGQATVDATTGQIVAGFAADDDFVVEGTRLDDDDQGWKIFAGQYLSRIAALEIAYIDFGKATFRTTVVDAPSPLDTTTPFDIRATADAKAISLVGLLHLPIGDVLSLFLSGGGFVWQAEFREQIPETGIVRVKRNEKGTDATYGAGVEINFANVLRLRGQWERFQKVGDGIGGREGADLELASVSIVFPF